MCVRILANKNHIGLFLKSDYYTKFYETRSGLKNLNLHLQLSRIKSLLIFILQNNIDLKQNTLACRLISQLKEPNVMEQHAL
jgi:hypothetical protein